jgi:uncharacterized protein YcgI (DUF1989 family)
MANRQIIAPGGGAALKLARGEHLRLIDIEGGQTGDLMAFSQDGSERLSNGRSFDYNGKLRLSVGDVLWSDRSNQMLTIVADDVGRHDFLYASCSLMNVDVLADGKLKILPPKCRKGDSMVLRAEMDLAIALSACPAGTCNDGPPRSLAFEAG